MRTCQRTRVVLVLGREGVDVTLIGGGCCLPLAQRYGCHVLLWGVGVGGVEGVGGELLLVMLGEVVLVVLVVMLVGLLLLRGLLLLLLLKRLLLLLLFGRHSAISASKLQAKGLGTGGVKAYSLKGKEGGGGGEYSITQYQWYNTQT